MQVFIWLYGSLTLQLRFLAEFCRISCLTCWSFLQIVQRRNGPLGILVWVLKNSQNRSCSGMISSGNLEVTWLRLSSVRYHLVERALALGRTQVEFAPQHPQLATPQKRLSGSETWPQTGLMSILSLAPPPSPIARLLWHLQGALHQAACHATACACCAIIAWKKSLSWLLWTPCTVCLTTDLFLACGPDLSKRGGQLPVLNERKTAWTSQRATVGTMASCRSHRKVTDTGRLQATRSSRDYCDKATGCNSTRKRGGNGA